MERFVIERIKIKINFFAEFWDQYPMIDISIDSIKISTHIINERYHTVESTVDLEMDKSHLLQIHRYNKSDDQCRIIDGEKKDQYIIIKNLLIDGIDIKNLIWSRSWYEPHYPESWVKEQIQAGIDLESKVLGETWLSHNGIWNFRFSSPVYKFIISQFRD